ncbi:methyltransferase (plasmid) [Mesorhizobium sp. AR02]|uniref:methyltransferase n=1 Tax=Mesorhizobium sp. AR02 TaxID=2865837 RepID=UPI00215E8E6B|nr:methyltransferase [Mesorhizobium sp. AR02]UVK49653.1 methyltransferase [Mesorhizobium sp. AR02]
MSDLDRVRARLALSQQHTFPLHMQAFGMDLVVNEGVFSPRDFHSWRWYAEIFPSVAGKSVLEIGCGFGLPGLYLARLGATSLVACDIDPKAVANTLENAARNGIRNVKVIQSDIFSNISPDQKFDFIFWNCPSIFAPSDYEYRDSLERGAINPGYKLLRRFLSEGPAFLTEAGSILLGLASDARDDLLSEILMANGLASVLLGSSSDRHVSVTYRIFSIGKRSRKQ